MLDLTKRWRQLELCESEEGTSAGGFLRGHEVELTDDQVLDLGGRATKGGILDAGGASSEAVLSFRWSESVTGMLCAPLRLSFIHTWSTCCELVMLKFTAEGSKGKDHEDGQR